MPRSWPGLALARERQLPGLVRGLALGLALVQRWAMLPVLVLAPAVGPEQAACLVPVRGLEQRWAMLLILELAQVQALGLGRDLAWVQVHQRQASIRGSRR